MRAAGKEILLHVVDGVVDGVDGWINYIYFTPLVKEYFGFPGYGEEPQQSVISRMRTAGKEMRLRVMDGMATIIMRLR